MDFTPLRTWLRLPPGPWPPDHYTLLGLPVGDGDPAAVEGRVLERMDALRPHQLVQPDLVTEGMNRLAQALICLTDPAARDAYDAGLIGGAASNESGRGREASGRREDVPSPGSPSLTTLSRKGRGEKPRPSPLAGEGGPGFAGPGEGTSGKAEDTSPHPGRGAEPPASAEGSGGQTEPDSVFDDLPDGPEDVSDRTQILELPFAPGLEPPRTPEPPPGAYTFEYEAPPSTLPPDDEPAAPAEAPPPGAVLPKRDRREVYRRLAAVRRALRGWADLRTTLADPEERFDHPSGVLALLRGVRALRPALDDVGELVGDVNRPGGLAAAVVRQPLVLATVRTLLPEQRALLAVDWRRGQIELQAEYNRLRRVVRARSRGRGSGEWAKAVRWLTRNPEAVLVAAGVLALFVAALRTITGR